MTAVKTIDLKGLASEERERLLFGALDEVRTGQSVQVSLEFNPLPLVYSLKAGGEFRVDYLKEGPEDVGAASSPASPSRRRNGSS